MTDPRIHERRVTVARQQGRRRRRLLLLGLVAVCLVAGGFALVHSPLLGARHVEVVGAHHTSRSAVVAVAGLDGSPPLVDLDAAVIARRVERLPWVATARVHIGWPSTVGIAITERVPVGALSLGGGEFALCDQTGRVLADTPAPPSGLPQVAAPGPVGRPGSRLGHHGALLCDVAGALPESMVAQIKEISWSSEGAELVLLHGPLAVVGGAEALGSKFVSLATVLAHGGLQGVRVVDLRVPAAPVLIRGASSRIVRGAGGG